MSLMLDAPWIVAEKFFNGIPLHPELQRAAQALAAMPFKDCALAYMGALNHAQASAQLGLPTAAVPEVTFSALQWLYGESARYAGLSVPQLPEIKRFPDLIGQRLIAEADEHQRRFNEWVAAYCKEHGIDPSTLK